MYGFTNSSIYGLSAEKILAKVPDSVLWRHYLGCNYELGKSIQAQYRIDRDPSFCLNYDIKSGKIMGRDYGKGGFHGDIFDYVQMLNKIDYYSALAKVSKDFDLGLGSGLTSSGTYVDRVALERFQRVYEQKEVLIQYKPRSFTKDDTEYWAQYGITGTTILKYRVYAAEKVWRDKALVYYQKKCDPCYVYYFPQKEYRKIARAKCYWPGRTKYRFMGNCSNDYDVQGYDQCSIANKQMADLLILTKSMKDCMVFHENGTESMATHGEAHRFSPDFIRHLKKYYKRIVSVYDRDITGMRGARYLWKEYQIYPYFINKKYASKDLSDLYKAHGQQVTKTFIQTIENDKKNHGDIHPKERPKSIQQ